MIPSAFEYERATSVDDALAKLTLTTTACYRPGERLVRGFSVRVRAEPHVMRMTRYRSCLLVMTLAWLAGLSGIVAAEPRPQTEAEATPHRALLNQYCVGCHNERTKRTTPVLRWTAWL